MKIDYDHCRNDHTPKGPSAVLPELLEASKFESVLDVGCGTGLWLKACLDHGLDNLLGIEGVHIPDSELVVPRHFIVNHDLTMPINIGRSFDLVLCLEVGEHLDEAHAATLIDTLVAHGSHIVFSAACPHQPGQHHVNCQWPSYWQALFNERGYTCNDSLRWRLWENPKVEWWYRQNIIEAFFKPSEAGSEPRINSIVHPEHLSFARRHSFHQGSNESATRIRGGGLPPADYLSMASGAIRTKLLRRLRR